MKIITKIFPNGGYYISSGWGYREYWYNGKLVKDFHNGIDYATYGKKLPQYAVEDGYIVSCGTASDGANYVWVAYPRIGKKFLHYHLDSICVKSGQSVKSGTLLGYTGMTGMATGIHLHLGMKNINGGDYQNPEEYNYTEPTPFNVGDKVRVETCYPYKYYIADEAEYVYGIYQVAEYLNAGGKEKFDWKDNGIPETCLDKVDSEGHKTPDSDKVHLKKGDKFVFARTFTIVATTKVNGVPYVLLEFDNRSDLRFWTITTYLKKV